MVFMIGDYQLASGSCHFETLKLLEADIHHANLLASSIPRDKDGSSVQMKLVYNNLVPIFWYFLQWMDCSCACLLSSYLSLFHIVVYKVSSFRIYP
ncbi:E3 ubiquitin-protein ligase AIRP2-like [Impatiens glandulifera]|uniref:E3 ubiquitin-protein ligase AIRP2-like n=1 Tax=Impatiens glandulifera TaxID=253017 RepID=UPI001FB18080|nr:E3 ubiquitin-protein ligase AIRP2-like [Impatiens glandulifera]